MNQGDLLSGALAMIPFYSIFGTPSVTTSAFEKLATIREHDWVTFGEEQKFWKCVANASL
ncbi:MULTISPECIES: hypothetical protein [Vibrio harveyi group]|nr:MULTISPECIES: hypothetical protein [Vibrio harveyi group]MCR9929808.1 hypothetical protein [Vibrio parahaemolyticus]WJT10939.1 hypothetical protein PH545_28025 [Vibrio harveyi]